MEIETDRLRLRPLTLDDDRFILELLNEPAWHRYIGDRGIRTIEGAQAYLTTGPIAMHGRLGIGLGAVELKSDGTVIGVCGLIQRETLPDVDLGFAFLTRFTGRGYAREAAAATLEFGERVRGLRRIVAITDPDNVRSIKLLQGLGFRWEQDIRLRPDSPVSKLWAYGATSTGSPIAT